jgi:hypothetical protein
MKSLLQSREAAESFVIAGRVIDRHRNHRENRIATASILTTAGLERMLFAKEEDGRPILSNTVQGLLR